MGTESKRQQRFAGVIQQDLAELFQKEGSVWAPGAFITVTREIRFKLGAKIKHQVRIVPQLDFFLDDTNEYVEHMDKLFDEISKETRQPD